LTKFSNTTSFHPWSAKKKSPTYRTFVEKYGITDAYELEALPPNDLLSILKNALEQVIHLDFSNRNSRPKETSQPSSSQFGRKGRKEAYNFLNQFVLEQMRVPDWPHYPMNLRRCHPRRRCNRRVSNAAIVLHSSPTGSPHPAFNEKSL
jgi:hypothetical protein